MDKVLLNVLNIYFFFNYDLEEVFETPVQEFDREGTYTIVACSRSEESDEVHYGVLLNETLILWGEEE